MNFPTKTTATSLAAALGEGWTVTHPEDGNSYVTRESDGLSLMASQVGYGPNPDRVQVSVRLARDEHQHAYQALYPQFTNPSTSFALARLASHPGAVASQVLRNVVAQGEAEYARLKEGMDKTAAYKQAQRDIFATLGLAPRDKPGRPGEMDSGTGIRMANGIWGHAEVTNTDVHLDLHNLSPEQALAVLGVLRG